MKTLTLKEKSYENNKEQIPLEYRTTNVGLYCSNKLPLKFKLEKKGTLDFKSEYSTLYLSDFGLFDLQKIANE